MTMMYEVYHVSEVKIGCTKYYPDRCLKQGFKENEFYIEDRVSEGCGPEFASRVERFWQWYYGLEESRGSSYELLEEKGRKGGNNLDGGFHTGVASKAAVASPNHISKKPDINPFLNGEAGRVGGLASIKSQIEKGIHSSQTGKAGYFTLTLEQRSKIGTIAAIARVKSQMERGTHISQQFFTCNRCGMTGKGPRMKRHINDGTLICKVA